MLERRMRHITGFEGKYAVTEDGHVYSVLRIDSLGRSQGGKFLTGTPDKNGYLRVSLTTENRRNISRIIHRLVAAAYIANPANKPAVNHKDGNKQNNHVSNLEWVTNKENTHHGWSLGLCHTYDRSLPYNRQGIIESNKRRTKGGI